MTQHDDTHSPQHPSIMLYVSVFVALLVLLVVTVVIAEIDLGLLNFPVAAAIATVKAVLILLYFMHVRYSKPLTWLFAGAGFFWLAILFGLTFSDYLTRGETPSRQPQPIDASHAQPAR